MKLTPKVRKLFKALHKTMMPKKAVKHSTPIGHYRRLKKIWKRSKTKKEGNARIHQYKIEMETYLLRLNQPRKKKAA